MQRLLLILVACLLCACTPRESLTKGYEQSLARANDTAAILTLRNIASAQQRYLLGNNSYGTFAQLVAAGDLDARFNSEKPIVSHFIFAMTVTQDSYDINADPEPTAPPGGRHYYSDSTNGPLNVNASQTAAKNDPSLDVQQ